MTGKFHSKDVVDSWPEIFGEVRFNTLPLRYLQYIIVNFSNGSIWKIAVTPDVKSSNWASFEKSLIVLFAEYEKNISSIEFKIETGKLKRDVQKMTSKFLKKKKLQ